MVTRIVEMFSCPTRNARGSTSKKRCVDNELRCRVCGACGVGGAWAARGRRVGACAAHERGLSRVLACQASEVSQRQVLEAIRHELPEARASGPSLPLYTDEARSGRATARASAGARQAGHCGAAAERQAGTPMRETFTFIVYGPSRPITH